MTQPPYNDLVTAARQAIERGWVPVPIRQGSKRPYAPRGGWQNVTLDAVEADEILSTFAEEEVGNLGLMLGAPSGNLVDVDLDNAKARRLASLVLPSTPMQTGRPSSRWSHRWYIVEGDLPETRKWVDADKRAIVEFRSTGAQSLVPPSRHDEDPEQYLWEGEPWGGEAGPVRIDGRVLFARTATLAMLAQLLDVWPARGSRHDAYLALVGGLVRTKEGVHPLWETTAAQVVATLAEASGDEDGPDARVAESVPSTIEKIRAGRAASGWPTLVDLIGEKPVDVVRRIAREIEHVLGWGSRAEPTAATVDVAGPSIEVEEVETDGPRSPLEERQSTWEPVDLGPYLAGEIELPSPGVLHRSDGAGLFYPGRVNLLYAKRESGKSWVTLAICAERMASGERVLYVDLEDEPDSTISRLRALGVPDETIRDQFVYLHPEDPLTAMTPLRFGEAAADDRRAANDKALAAALAAVQPTLVIVDGMTVLYALHGLASSVSEETDRINGWLKTLTRRGEASVVLVDHVRKSASRGDDPIGSQHKMAMVSGVAYHCWVEKPLRIGAVGEIDLLVGKDRIGAVRQVSTNEDPQVAATLRFISTEDGARMEVAVSAASEAVHVDVEDEGAIADAVNAADPSRRMDALLLLDGEDFDSVTAWRRAIEGVGPKVRPSRPSQVITDALREQGFAKVVEGKGGRLSPALTDRGREVIETGEAPV